MLNRMTNKNAGFTLIEVLVAMLVLAFGLLGLANLQATSLRNNQSAYHRSQATQLAYDMADRIRANPVESKDLADGKVAGKTLADSEYFKTSPQATTTEKTSCKTNGSTACGPTVMAKVDRREWLESIGDKNNGLPSGTGSIARVAGTRNITITITWDDNRDGDVDGHVGSPVGDSDSDGDTDDDPFFQMSFQI